MDNANTNQQTRPADYFRPIWARRWLIALIVAIATACTYVYYNGKPRVYSSSATLYVGGGSDISSVIGGAGSVADSPDPDRTLTDLSQLMTSPPVVAKAEQLIGNPAALGSIAATPASDSDFILLASTSTNPADAAATVNAYAKAFIGFETESLQREAAVALAEVEDQLKGLNNPAEGVQLQQQISELKLDESEPADSIQQIAPAVSNDIPLSPNPKKNAMFAFALSLMLGISLAYGLDRLDQRIRDEEGLQGIYGVPVVGEIPHVLSPTPHQQGVPSVASDQWESFRALRTNLELATGSKPLRTILVASAQNGEGKSLVTRNLALAYADAGLRVAILEADLRRPSLARLLNVGSEPGLADVLSHVELLPGAVQSVGTMTEDIVSRSGSMADSTAVAVSSPLRAGTLDVVTSGQVPESITAALAANGIKSVLARMTELYDVVIVDSAPLLAVSDSVPLIGVVDGVVMVARIGVTTERAGRRVAELLNRVQGARILGVVANGIRRRPFPYSSNYSG